MYVEDDRFFFKIKPLLLDDQQSIAFCRSVKSSVGQTIRGDRAYKGVTSDKQNAIDHSRLVRFSPVLDPIKDPICHKLRLM